MSAPALEILYVGPLPPYTGGSARSATQLLQRLQASGCSVRALAPMARAARSSETLAFPVRRFAVPAFGFDHTRPPGPPAAAQEARLVLAGLESEARRRLPEVIFVGREPYAPVVVPWAKRRRVPVLVRTPGGTMLEILAGRYPRVAGREIVAALHAADAVVSPARHLAAAMKTQLGLRRVRVVRNAVALDDFTPCWQTPARRRPQGASSRTVMHISNLVSCKRPLDLIEAAERLRVLSADTFRFVVVGDGPLRRALAAEAARRRLDFRFRGQVAHARIPALLARADVLAMPGDADTMPRACMEALAAGTVLVMSDIPAARELAGRGHAALLVPVGDHDALAQAILRGCSDERLRALLRRRGRRRIAGHGLEHAAAEYLRLLRRLRDRAAGRVPRPRRASNGGEAPRLSPAGRRPRAALGTAADLGAIDVAAPRR